MILQRLFQLHRQHDICRTKRQHIEHLFRSGATDPRGSRTQPGFTRVTGICLLSVTQFLMLPFFIQELTLPSLTDPVFPTSDTKNKPVRLNYKEHLSQS